MDFGLSGIVGNMTGEKWPVKNSVLENSIQDTRDMYGGLRKAGQIFKANPIGAILTDLIFPEPMADGTLDAAMKKGILYPRGK